MPTRFSHLTDEQKELALDYAQNLSLFLNDGMFQFADVDSIPALGDVRFTDGAVEVVYYNQYDERYADQPLWNRPHWRLRLRPYRNGHSGIVPNG